MIAKLLKVSRNLAHLTLVLLNNVTLLLPTGCEVPSTLALFVTNPLNLLFALDILTAVPMLGPVTENLLVIFLTTGNMAEDLLIKIALSLAVAASFALVLSLVAALLLPL